MKLRILPLAAAALGGAALGIWQNGKRGKKKADALQNRIHVLSDHFQLLNHWLEIKGEGKSTADYFKEMGYGHIAIYGMADLGIRLTEDLDGGSVVVDYGIDRDISCSIARIEEVYTPEDDLPDTDVIVVTPYAVFEEIKKNLEKKVNCPIVSLEEVVWSV
ncbi:MAG: hypothetical protein HFH82_09080 [Lachnospiraceae bacterium]|nr:hypothetical protein [Lachnospiraceae bacterium]